MGFIKPRTIYKKETTHIYINECHNKGKKTRLFTVRRDDSAGFGDILGFIRFSGGWRQYLFEPDKNTKWASSCGRVIFDFCDEMTIKWREGIKKRRIAHKCY